jgi:RimJ/RimL family protein N-acetyltransferase
MVQLETQRLLLRSFRQADLDDYARLCADSEVMKYIGKGEPLSRADAWRSMAFHLGHWQLQGFGQWAVEWKETGRMIGRIGLFYPEGWPGLEVGWGPDRPRIGTQLGQFVPDGCSMPLFIHFDERWHAVGKTSGETTSSLLDRP